MHRHRTSGHTGGGLSLKEETVATGMQMPQSVFDTPEALYMYIDERVKKEMRKQRNT
jgi:hypothetical protein